MYSYVNQHVVCQFLWVHTFGINRSCSNYSLVFVFLVCSSDYFFILFAFIFFPHHTACEAAQVQFSWAKYYFSCVQTKAASKIVRRTKNDLADYFLERTGLQV